MDKLKLAEQALVNENIPEFESGDTVNVHYRVREGEKERIQQFEGLVISRRGTGPNQTFIVRKISAGNIGVERIFPLYSPFIAKIEVKKRGDVRRAKLYYLRERQGKSARIKEKDRDATQRIEEREQARVEAREQAAAEEAATKEAAEAQDAAAEEAEKAAAEEAEAAEETAETAAETTEEKAEVAAEEAGSAVASDEESPEESAGADTAAEETAEDGTEETEETAAETTDTEEPSAETDTEESEEEKK